MTPRQARAVFLDKDGTLIENLPYNVDPARIKLTAGAAEGVAALAARGYRLIVISNQPGVALGRFDEAQLGGVERRLRELLPGIDAFYYCPHAPEQGCDCRKPSCGMLLRASQRHRVGLADSWMVGDILDDVEAGCRAGCRTVLLDNGNETEWRMNAARLPDRFAADLRQAAELILESADVA